MPTSICRIVLVEDEDFIRTVTAFALEDADFVVLEARCADEALGILEREAVDVLFTDLNMPGAMDGLGLAQHVKQKWPHVEIIATSGRPRPAMKLLPLGSRFIPKPYDLEAVVQQVQELTPTPLGRDTSGGLKPTLRSN